MENKEKPLNWRQKHFLTEFDEIEPYRLTSPALSLAPLRFERIEDAEQSLELARELGVQAILSKVNTQLCKIQVIGYSAPIKIIKRKE